MLDDFSFKVAGVNCHDPLFGVRVTKVTLTSPQQSNKSWLPGSATRSLVTRSLSNTVRTPFR